jgi:adenylate cyclase, class 2
MDILEIEIKSHCDDHGPVAERLGAMGARHVGTRTELDLYLNHPCRDFRNTDEALRLRRAGGRVILTYKGPKIGTAAKTRREEEVDVADFEKTTGILGLLGFVEFGSVAKERSIYRLGDVEICLDTVDGVGRFVEIEKKGSDRERIEGELFHLAGELGLDRFERRSYLEMKYGAPGAVNNTRG